MSTQRIDLSIGNPPYGKSHDKPRLLLHASFNPYTRSWTFDATDQFGQLLASDFGKAPKEAIANDSDGIAFALAQAYRAIEQRFSSYVVTDCLTQLRGAKGQQRWAA